MVEMLNQSEEMDEITYSYLVKMESVIKSSNGNVTEIQQGITEIEGEAIAANLSSSILAPIMSYGETAKASAVFWETNKDLLSASVTTNSVFLSSARATGDAPWWIIVAADAAGAAEGTVAGIMLWGTVPPLQVLPVWAVAAATATIDSATSSALTYQYGVYTLAGTGTLIKLIAQIGEMASLQSGVPFNY
jgi:hypothetical protein